MGGEGAHRAGTGRAASGGRAERGDGGAHPAVGGGDRAAQRCSFCKGRASARPPGGSAPGVFQRHGAHRQGVPGRCRGAARHRRRAGGRRSEFMRHSWRSGFKDECRERGLPLLVLPPRSPQLNGTAVLHRRSEAPGSTDPGSAGVVAIDCRHGCVIRYGLPTPQLLEVLVLEPLHRELLLHASRSDCLNVAAEADNCRFDEWAGGERWRRFEALVKKETSGVANWDDWRRAYNLHLGRSFHVPQRSVPDAFLDLNQGAWLTLPADRSLLRVENLSVALGTNGYDFNGLKDLLRRADEGEADAIQEMHTFFNAWNQRRDARPAFAALWDEVQEELDDCDWHHALRDRLGLGNYDPKDGRPIPIALMRYSVADVHSAQKGRRLQAACAVPTVLDGGMRKFFFPVPKEKPSGATVHLVPSKADTLTTEVLHCRIDYEHRHLSRLGEITRPIPDDEQLRKARDLHLYALQESCGREDFGEPLEDRT